MKPILTAIAAMSENRTIGRNNQLPWHLPADLKHFKITTSGHTIIMGRKTYQSIGRPLPNRRNIILTRDPKFQAPGCETATSVADVLALLKPQDEAFIIGGAEIYQLFFPHLQRLHLTLIHHSFEGDAYFPMFDMSKWQKISEEMHLADNENPYNYTFVVFEKN